MQICGGTAKEVSPMATTYDRFYKAVLILSGRGSIQERLAEAFRNELQYVPGEGLTEMTRVELAEIQDQMTRIEPSGEKDSIERSAELLSDSDAEEVASEILDIYDRLAKEQAMAARH